MESRYWPSDLRCEFPPSKVESFTQLEKVSVEFNDWPALPEPEWAEGMQQIPTIPFLIKLSHRPGGEKTRTQTATTLNISLCPKTHIVPKTFLHPNRFEVGFSKGRTPLFRQHLNRATSNSHMQWISLSVYWGIMIVNFLSGSHVHPRVTRAHANCTKAQRNLLHAPQLFPNRLNPDNWLLSELLRQAD